MRIKAAMITVLVASGDITPGTLVECEAITDEMLMAYAERNGAPPGLDGSTVPAK